MELTKNSKLFLLGVAIPSTVGLLYLLVKFLFQDEEDKITKKYTTSRQTVIEIPIPRKAVGAIIGRQGANIKQLQENSGAKMNFKDDAKENTDDDRTLLIRGTTESAQRAEFMVKKALADLPVIVQDEVMVPGYCLGRIIGQGGENVRQMSRSSNTKIYVDRTQERFRDKPRLITIQGTKEHIVIAKNLIQEKVDEEEEFRARTAVSAANRELRYRSKESKYNHVTKISYQEDQDETAQNVQSDLGSTLFDKEMSIKRYLLVPSSGVDDTRCCFVESTQHYFFGCQDLRDTLNNRISTITRVTLQVIVFGDDDLNISENERIFAAVHSYISLSRRFT